VLINMYIFRHVKSPSNDPFRLTVDQPVHIYYQPSLSVGEQKLFRMLLVNFLSSFVVIFL
jgi:hypothetical protein